MSNYDATHYTYRVAWSAEDDEHVATVAEFPSLSWLAPDPQEALGGLVDLVRDVVDDMAAREVEWRGLSVVEGLGRFWR